MRAEDIGPHQRLYGDRGAETGLASIALAPSGDDVRYSIVQTDKKTGAEGRCDDDAPFPEMPEPVQMQKNHRGTPVILLSAEYRWRHNWQEARRIMETFAFRPTDIALAEDSAYGQLTFSC